MTTRAKVAPSAVGSGGERMWAIAGMVVQIEVNCDY